MARPTSAMVIADVPTRLRVIDEATVNNLIKKDPSFCGPALSLDCGHPCRAAPADVDAPRLPHRRDRLLQPDPRRDRGRRCQAARAGLAAGLGGGRGRARAKVVRLGRRRCAASLWSAGHDAVARPPGESPIDGSWLHPPSEDGIDHPARAPVTCDGPLLTISNADRHRTRTRRPTGSQTRGTRC